MGPGVDAKYGCTCYYFSPSTASCAISWGQPCAQWSWRWRQRRKSIPLTMVKVSPCGVLDAHKNIFIKVEFKGRTIYERTKIIGQTTGNHKSANLDTYSLIFSNDSSRCSLCKNLALQRLFEFDLELDENAFDVSLKLCTTQKSSIFSSVDLCCVSMGTVESIWEDESSWTLLKSNWAKWYCIGIHWIHRWDAGVCDNVVEWLTTMISLK